MTATSTSRTFLLTVLGVGALGGAGVTYLAIPQRSASALPAAANAPSSSMNAAAPIVRLSPDDIARAHITVTPVQEALRSDSITIPGLVEPNAYRQTVVTPLVAGRVTRVLAELGQQVRRGQVLAEVYSPELAEAQREYISATGELRAHEQQLARIDSLVTIGSASRRELEMAHAEHAAMTSRLEASRTRLALIGLTAEHVDTLTSASQIAATTEVRAPLDGVVTARGANVGTNVDGAMPLFTVVDLSTVWVVGDLYEHDLPRVGVGRPATVSVSAFPELLLHGTISYIDPQLSRETRTAKVRVEVQNSQALLRLGMYAQVRIDTVSDHLGAVIPRAAIQTIGDHTVVYVADPSTPGLFIERTIRTGGEAGDRVFVESGVTVGESIASTGSFSLRAERERQGQSGAAAVPAASIEPRAGNARQTARVTVSDKGFEPTRVIVESGVPAVITFVRTTDATCAKEVIFPSLNIRRELPLDTPVAIELTPSHTDLGFVCGMGMFKGTIASN